MAVRLPSLRDGYGGPSARAKSTFWKCESTIKTVFFWLGCASVIGIPFALAARAIDVSMHNRKVERLNARDIARADAVRAAEIARIAVVVDRAIADGAVGRLFADRGRPLARIPAEARALPVAPPPRAFAVPPAPVVVHAAPPAFVTGFRGGLLQDPFTGDYIPVSDAFAKDGICFNVHSLREQMGRMHPGPDGSYVVQYNAAGAVVVLDRRDVILIMARTSGHGDIPAEARALPAAPPPRAFAVPPLPAVVHAAPPAFVMGSRGGLLQDPFTGDYIPVSDAFAKDGICFNVHSLREQMGRMHPGPDGNYIVQYNAAGAVIVLNQRDVAQIEAMARLSNLHNAFLRESNWLLSWTPTQQIRPAAVFPTGRAGLDLYVNCFILPGDETQFFLRQHPNFQHELLVNADRVLVAWERGARIPPNVNVLGAMANSLRQFMPEEPGPLRAQFERQLNRLETLSQRARDGGWLQRRPADWILRAVFGSVARAAWPERLLPGAVAFAAAPRALPGPSPRQEAAIAKILRDYRPPAGPDDPAGRPTVLDPRRPGTDFVIQERGLASALLAQAPNDEAAMLAVLTRVFSSDRAQRILDAIIALEDEE